jgi:hypothetical protein
LAQFHPCHPSLPWHRWNLFHQ